MKRFSWNWILVGIIAFAANGYATTFPQVKTVYDTEDVLEKYEPYFQFVVEAGRTSDPKGTQRLVSIYSNLKKRSPEGAARFLKGLRFEMIHKAELMGISSLEVSSSDAKIRNWVGKFMKEWVREADEHYFRSFTPQLARK